MKITPLLRFLRALTKEQRTEWARDCGTTVQYLYQLAAQPAPNPQLRLALALVALSKRYARKQMTSPLVLEDLLVGVPRDLDDADDGAPGSH